MLPPPAETERLSGEARAASGWTLAAAVGWTVVALLAVGWTHWHQRRQVLELAEKEARANFKKDLAFREWATRHGGVYVFPDERTPPNEFLSHLPHRDLQTTSGQTLTLMNPAYMMRQLTNEYERDYGIKGHLTSLTLLNPVNEPDPWERAVLEGYEDDPKPVVEQADIDGEPYLRTMQPMWMTEGCESCHGILGFEEGDLRGGISVSVPLKPYLDELVATSAVSFGSISVFWGLGLFGIFRYARTHRRQLRRLVEAELELRRNQERFALAAHGSTDGLWDWIDIARDEVWWSPRTYQLLGLDEGAAPSFEMLTGLVHPDDRPAFLRAVRDHLRDRAPFHVEARVQVRGAGYRWFLARGAARRNEIGRAVRMSGSLQDITARKVAEAALAESEARFKAIFEHASDGVLVIDPSGPTVVLANAHMAEILGTTPGELGPETLAGVLALLDPKPGSHTRVRLDGQDGRAVLTEVSFATFEIGGQPFLTAFFRDVTTRVAMEERLRQSQKLEAVGTLAGGVAHDFNNVLGAILGFSELTLLHELDPRTRQNVERIVTASERARALVAQLLTFSRRGPSAFHPVSLNAIVREALDLVRATLPANIDIQSALPDPEVWVEADATQLHQMLVNLCTNSAHALEKGGHIRVSVTPGAPDRVLLVVQDDGEGIAPDVLPHVFDPFYTTKPVGKGTGLGLSVVHGIVDAHRGEITIDSVEGEGTTVTIRLPTCGPADAEGPAESDAASSLRGRVLLVDDEPHLLSVLTKMLEHFSCEVASYQDPEAALAAFREDPVGFDLVITDLAMPGLDGRALGQAILALAPDLPVVVCSGFSKQPSDAAFRAEGFAGFLQKPVTLGTLRVTLERVLG